MRLIVFISLLVLAFAESSNSKNEAQDDVQPDLIPLGSCHKCMNYCDFCEPQCQNSKIGQYQCDRCHAKCSTCRSLCSDLRPKRSQEKENCSEKCHDICARGNKKGCKDCYSKCNVQPTLSLFSEQCYRPTCKENCHIKCSGWDTETGCKYCYCVCGKQEQNFINSDLGNVQLDEKKVQENTSTSSNCDQRCELMCKGKIRRASRQCKKCLKKCEESGGSGSLSAQKDNPITELQRKLIDDLCFSICRDICYNDPGSELCHKCMNNCQAHVGNIANKDVFGKKGDCSVCDGVCSSDASSAACSYCLCLCNGSVDNCFGHDNLDGVQNQVVIKNPPKLTNCDDECKEFCQYGPNLGCDLCMKNCKVQSS